MQRFRVECNFGSKYFDDIFNARRYRKRPASGIVEGNVSFVCCKKGIFGNARVNGILRIFAIFEVKIILER